MKILILGGTAWLGRETAAAAVVGGHEVTCLARGHSGQTATGAGLVVADRERRDAYDAVVGSPWDAVIDVGWQPGWVRGALDALAGSARHWLYVSSVSVYAETTELDGNESTAVLPVWDGDVAGDEQYGEAKVACELACHDRVGDRLLVARPGVIAGRGDTSDRCGYWVARAARSPGEPMLAPVEQEGPTQIVDVRDLAAWLILAAENAVVGTFNAVGPRQPFSDWLATSRQIGGHTGDVVTAPSQWLARQGVAQFAGPESMAMWIADPGVYGFAARNGDAAHAAGLRCRPLSETLRDVLGDERHRGLNRPRDAGLSATREQQLINLVRHQRLTDLVNDGTRAPPH